MDKQFSSYEYMNNENLSLKAKGLLTILLSWTSNTKPSVEHLVNLCGDGKTSVQATILELKGLGYLKSSPIMEEGRIKTWEWDWNPSPIFLENGNKKEVENALKQVKNLKTTCNKKYKEIEKRYLTRIGELDSTIEKLELELKEFDKKNKK